MSGLKPNIRAPHPIERIVLVPGGGGIFDVHADGQLIFCKHKAGRHPDPEEIILAIRTKLAA